MTQADRNKLAKLISDNKNWLQSDLNYTIQEYVDLERSGFVHTMSLGEYLLKALLEESLIDPKIKAERNTAAFLRSALRQARDKANDFSEEE